MKLNSFSFKKFEGMNFAKLSGDYNAIHINEMVGYNSIYGENIVHGSFVIFKFLKKIKLKDNFTYLKILFNDAIKYNHRINIKKIRIYKKKKIYELIQLNNTVVRIEVGFFPEENKLYKLKNISFRKKYFINKKKKINLILKIVIQI